MNKFPPSTVERKLQVNNFFRKFCWFSFLLCFCMLLIGKSNAQNTAKESTVSVKGFVINQNGEPLSGVSVMVKGSTIATLTGNDGSFQLQAPVNSTISVSYVGYINKDLKIGNNDRLNLNL